MHRRFTSFVAHVLAACVPVLGLAVAVGAGPASAARAPVNARTAALAALKHLKIGEHGTDHAVRGHSVRARGRSTNWSGYAGTKTSSRYSKVTGSWTQPKGTCGSRQSFAAFWAGIDGFTSGTVEQAGTLIECKGGTPFYFTWWEVFPANAIQVVGSTVKPGDPITVSVTRSGTSYTLKVADSAHPANGFTTTQSCASGTCVDSSAEWIAEAPSQSMRVLPLTNFGTWTLKGATVTAGTRSGTIKTFPHQRITMVDGRGRVKAQTGPLNTAGNQFKVSWKHST